MITEVDWRHTNSLETKIVCPISKQSIEIGNIFQLKIFRFSFLIKRKSRNPAYVSDLIDSFKATYCVSNLISLFPNDGYLFRILVWCFQCTILFQSTFNIFNRFFVVNWHCFQFMFPSCILPIFRKKSFQKSDLLGKSFPSVSNK